MTFLHKAAALAAHDVWFPGFHATLARVSATEWANAEECYALQSDRLLTMIRFALRRVPYYRRTAAHIGVDPEDIETLFDVAKLPIVTREDVSRQRMDFLPDGRWLPSDRDCTTSGTSGTPLRYRLSRSDRAIGLALMYRGWGYAGYRVGDGVVVLAGSSLGAKHGQWHRRLGYPLRNMVKLSAFDMTDKSLDLYIEQINRMKPMFIRGYPGAVQVLANRVHCRRISVWQPRAVFTTSEILLPAMRERISGAFGCPVFDGYGLNDGGVSAYECESHSGLHIDTERSLLQVVDEQGRPLMQGTGRIVATTLTNYAMPLIRYDTGDLAEVDQGSCPCGRTRTLLKRICGRSTDILVTPEGKLVHGWFFVFLFRDLSQHVQEFRVVQESIRELSILVIPAEEFHQSVLAKLREAISELSPGWVVRIQTVQALPHTVGDKMKFVESKIGDGGTR